jgi:hypothetical protein
LDESQNSDGRREWSKQNTDQCDCHVVTSIWWRIETIARKWRTTQNESAWVLRVFLTLETGMMEHGNYRCAAEAAEVSGRAA